MTRSRSSGCFHGSGRTEGPVDRQYTHLLCGARADVVFAVAAAVLSSPARNTNERERCVGVMVSARERSRDARGVRAHDGLDSEGSDGGGGGGGGGGELAAPAWVSVRSEADKQARGPGRETSARFRTLCRAAAAPRHRPPPPLHHRRLHPDERRAPVRTIQWGEIRREEQAHTGTKTKQRTRLARPDRRTPYSSGFNFISSASVGSRLYVSYVCMRDKYQYINLYVCVCACVCARASSSCLEPKLAPAAPRPSRLLHDLFRTCIQAKIGAKKYLGSLLGWCGHLALAADLRASAPRTHPAVASEGKTRA
jgi:hypothetical protein